jgi:hypothetical protein
MSGATARSPPPARAETQAPPWPVHDQGGEFRYTKREATPWTLQRHHCAKHSSTPPSKRAAR